MRIALIRMRYTPFGGAERFLERFVEGLKARGHTVEVFSSRWEGAGAAFKKVGASGPKALKPLVFAMNARKAVEAARPDCVISLERTYCQDIYRAGDGCHREWLIRKGERSPWWKRLATAVNPLHLTLLYLEKRLFKDPGLKAVVANSRMVKADITRHYGLPDEKIHVIYNGVDPGAAGRFAGERGALRKELKADEGTVILLFVGSGFERKGLSAAIRALALLEGDVRLVAVGKGRPERYRREAERLGVGGRVVFMGPRKDALRFYGASDIFVLPTIYEPFSNACLEAMSAALPVVTTVANGASEIIRDGVSGGVVSDPSDAEELAAKIRPFLEPAARGRAGQEAAKTAAHYTMERTVDAFLEVVEGIAAQRA